MSKEAFKVVTRKKKTERVLNGNVDKLLCLQRNILIRLEEILIKLKNMSI